MYIDRDCMLFTNTVEGLTVIMIVIIIIIIIIKMIMIIMIITIVRKAWSHKQSIVFLFLLLLWDFTFQVVSLTQ